jgi:galactokinase
VALARALGAEGDPIVIATLCQRAEAAAGSAVGLMDPLVSMAGRRGHALLVDFSTLRWEPVAMAGTELVVVHSGITRTLADSPYAERRAECAAAAREIGIPLGRATMADVDTLRDPTLRRRSRHVVTECARVRTVARLLRDGDPAGAGRVLSDSHRSQAEDFAASNAVVDQLVELLVATPGVHGARMTGGGFGGCVVALADPGAVELARFGGRALRVEPSDGAIVTVTA